MLRCAVQQYTTAFETGAAGAAAGPAVNVTIDLERFPVKLGDYWLGPIDPTRPHDDPG